MENKVWGFHFINSRRSFYYHENLFMVFFIPEPDQPDCFTSVGVFHMPTSLQPLSFVVCFSLLIIITVGVLFMVPKDGTWVLNI